MRATAAATAPPPPSAAPDGAAEPARREPADPGPIVRPYAFTGGRTRTRREIAVEALVFSTPTGRMNAATLAPERRAIAGMCRRALSVAEVAARLRVPLGVARVLVADLADEGLLRVHQPDRDRACDPALLERVLAGLRRL